MIRLTHQVNQALHLIREGNFDEIGKRLSRRFRHEWISYGLQRDLSIPITPPKARIPIAIREMRQSDIPHLFPKDRSKLAREERLELAAREAHLLKDIPTCFVAIDLRHDIPCFIQWLMGPEQNDEIQRFFKGRFPSLQRDEAILENAYTPSSYRGNGIMPAAMAMIADRAVEMGCRYVNTFVDCKNTASLKGCSKAGFIPYITRHDTSMLFNLLKRRRFVKT